MDQLIGLRLDVEALAYRLTNVRSDTDDLIHFRNYYRQDIIDAKNMCYGLQRDMTNVDKDVTAITNDIKTINQNITNLTTWIDIIKNLQTQVIEMKNEINELKKKK